MAFEVKGGAAGQSINDAFSGSARQPVDRTASSDNKSTPTPAAKLASKQTQAAARPLSPGAFAGFGRSLAAGGLTPVNTQVTDKDPSAKTGPALQLANTSPSSTSTPARQSAVARQAQKIISAVENEVQNFISDNPKDAIRRPDFVLTVLNEAYQNASSGPLKRALLADPRVQKLLEWVVNAASGKIPGAGAIQCEPFFTLDKMLKEEMVDPAIKHALLSSILKDGSEAMDALHDWLPSEDERIALGKLTKKEYFRKLPSEIRFSVLFHIEQFATHYYANKYYLDNSKQSSIRDVIKAFALLVDKAWFRQPPNRKLALSDQHLFVKLISVATEDGDVQDTLKLLDPQGPTLRWCDFQKMGHQFKDVDAQYGKGVIWLDRAEDIEITGLYCLPHEQSHAINKDDLAPAYSDRRFRGELMAYIKGFKKQNGHLPNTEEMFLIISDNFLRDGTFYAPIKRAFDAGTAEGLNIAQRIGELIGWDNATPADIRKFNSAFLRGQMLLSPIPLSQKFVDDWLSARIPPRVGDDAVKSFFYDARFSDYFKD